MTLEGSEFVRPSLNWLVSDGPYVCAAVGPISMNQLGCGLLTDTYAAGSLAELV